MRVLVVEDEVGLAETIREGLVRVGFTVDLAHDGVEGLWTAAEHPHGAYDVIVLDIMLPRLSGYEVCRRLRGRGVWTPVLMLTAKDGEHDHADALDLGADDYLVKPFAWEELSARVRSLMRRGHQQTTSTLSVGDLEIDTAKKNARRAGKAIDLSAREYSLLEYLAHRQNQVVSRTEIWEHLWDEHDEVSSNVVDVYIGYLRNKIDKEFDPKLIHTRRGQGYMLSAEP